MIYFIGNPNISFVEEVGIKNASIEELTAYLDDKTEIGFDEETTGFDVFIDRILAYQFGDSEHQFVVDAIMYPIEILEDILLDKELIIHNSKFDFKFLYYKGIYPQKVWDTYLGECVLHKGDKTIRRSLEATVHRYFNYLLTKTTRGKILREGFSERVIKYCAEDVKFLPDIRVTQYNKLAKQNLLDSMSLENLFVKVLTYIEYSGIYLDASLWKKKVEQDEINLRDSLSALDSWIMDNHLIRYIDTQLDMFNTTKRTLIDWSSPKQVAELFGNLGIDTKVTDEKTGKLKNSVDVTVIERQKDRSTIIPIYIAYKKCEKTISTYGETVLSKIHPVTGRIHTQFTQVMSTGRLSSGGKVGDRENINLQNIPRLPDESDRIPGKIYERECFTCEPGNVLVNADYSGQEQIVFANWTLDKDILDFYEKGSGDMHSFVAQKIFPYLKNTSLNEIKSKYKRERQIAKSAGFAINYGGDGNTIAENLNILQEEGEAIYKAYFDAFPGVSNYFKQVTNQALQSGYILFNSISNSKCYISFFDQYKNYEAKVSKIGFWEKYREEKAKDSVLYRNELKPLVRRYFKLRGNISRMAVNYPVQGSAAEIIKLACIYIFNYILSNNLIGVVKFSNICHDEVILECPKSMSDIISKMVESCMDRAGNIYCKVVPLRCEIETSTFWSH